MTTRYKNNFKVHETEGYQLERSAQQKLSDVSDLVLPVVFFCFR